MRFELLAAGSVGLTLLVLTTPLRHQHSLTSIEIVRVTRVMLG